MNTISKENIFSTAHLSSNLKRLSVKGGVATLSGQIIKFLLNITSTIVLARLLTPQDFGLIAMVTALTGFIMVFKELGLSQATVQRAEINHGQVSTLFWINVAVGVLLMLITLALAPAIAWFYKDPRLVAVTAVLSIAFVFTGLTVQHEALLRRQMRLTTVAIRDVVAMAAGIVTALLCAWAGLGYWSLVWMQFATAATNSAFVWSASGWVPGRPVRRSGVRSMLKFGGWLTGAGFVNYFSRNLDSILIGRYCGALPLGLYARSYSLLLLPIGQIVAPMTSVAVPALCQLQRDPDRYRNYYIKAVTVIAYLSCPLVITLAVLAKQVMSLALGDKWLAAVPVFQVLAITALFQPIVSTVGWIYVSLGQTRRMALWGIVTSTLISISFVLGLPWGPVGVAASYAACTVLLVYPEFYVAMDRSPISPMDVFGAVYRPLCLGLLIGSGMFVMQQVTAIASPILGILFSGLVGAMITLLTCLCWRNVRHDIRDIGSICTSFRK